MNKQIYKDNKVELVKINKSFQKNKVLFDVDFNLKKGEIHGIVGQNGAGKSTLIKILNGVHTRDSGEIIINGKNILENPIKSNNYGIGTVFQELSLIPNMTVSENIFLGNEFKRGFLINDSYAKQETERILCELKIGLDISYKDKVGNLDISSSQIVEIAKTLSRKNEILILDEPTASLTYKETELLFEVIGGLKEKGISIILISHYLEDIFMVCDRVTILRDGKKILTDYIKNLTLNKVVDCLVGEDILIRRERKRKIINKSDTPLLEVICLKNDSKNKLKDIKFKVYKDEIVGIAGLLGSGKTEILNSIYGFDRKCDRQLKINGKTVKINNVNDARKNGIGLVPEDRKKQSLILDFSIRDNILLPILDKLTYFLPIINDTKGNKIVLNLVKKLKIVSKSINQNTKSLSGGNQQKTAIVKTMADSNLKLLLLDDPTTGIDIRSKQEIYSSIQDFVEAGNGVILVSSELSELIENCNRIIVIKDGIVKQELSQSEIENYTVDKLLKII